MRIKNFQTIIVNSESVAFAKTVGDGDDGEIVGGEMKFSVGRLIDVVESKAVPSAVD